jgi:hypothetical protein
MIANPKPNKIVASLEGESTVGDPNSDGPVLTYPFEVQGRVPGIALPEFEPFPGNFLDFLWQGIEGLPKTGSRERFQGNGRHSPASYSLSAFSARVSNLPVPASASTWRSHLSAMYCSNHRLNSTSCSGVSCRTDLSTFSTALIKGTLPQFGPLEKPFTRTEYLNGKVIGGKQPIESDRKNR